jgi:hypothetical protein
VTTAIETEGTISIPADWRIDRSGTIPSLVITIDPGDLAEIGGTGWQFDSLLNVGVETGTDIALQYYPNGDNED